jgi:acetyltransferase-like isoleucine patch superfamily enzyme
MAQRRRALAGYLLAQVVYSNERLTMGRASYGEPRIPIYPGDETRVTVGSFVSIAVDVVLMDGGNHRTDWVTTFPLRSRLDLPGAFEDGQTVSKGDVDIGSDVWIGRGAHVLSGVTVGHGAVIGGYSVVTKDVPPYTIVAGNPAREIRKRFSDEQIEALLAIAWWDWPQDKILGCVEELSSPDVEAFIAHHRQDAGQQRVTVRG